MHTSPRLADMEEVVAPLLLDPHLWIGTPELMRRGFVLSVGLIGLGCWGLVG